MLVRRLHYFSGLLLSLFIGIHLLNHIYGIGGAERHIALMDSLRLVYRNIAVESLLLLAIGVQVVTGLRLVRALKGLPKVGWDKWHILSGLYLAFFLLLHVTAILVGRSVLQLDTNYYFGAAGMNAFPSCLFFVPYYILAIVAVAIHVASVHQKKAKGKILGLTPNAQAIGFLVIGIVVTVLVFWGMTNGFKGVEVPTPYQILQGKSL